MKKLIIVVTVATLGLSACKKDYLCSYDYDQSGEEKKVYLDCNSCSKSEIKDVEAEPTEWNGSTYYYTCTAK